MFTTAADDEAAGGRLTASEPYRPAGGLALTVTLLLAAYVVASLLSMASSYVQIGLLERASAEHTEVEVGGAEGGGPVTDQEAEANDTREAVVGLLLLAVFLANVVAFLIWLHRAYSNLPALGNPKEGLDYSPGWAVGGWFIPLAHLVVPYLVVREVWAKSDPAVRTRDDLKFAVPSFSPLALAWWLMWVVSNVAGNLSFRFGADAETPADFIFSTKWDILCGALNVVSAALAILVVRSVARRQEERSRHVVYAPPGPPPPAAP